MVLGREPVLWMGLVAALVALGMGFGLKMSTEQMGLVMAAVAAILAFIARSQVTPSAPKTVDDLKTYIAKADPAVIDKAGVQIVNTARTLALLFGLVVAALLFARPAVAQPMHAVVRNGVAVSEPDSSIFATWRFAGYASAGAAAFARGDTTFSSFFPGAGVSYSWTNELQTSANLEGDVARKAYFASVGMRLLTYESGGDAPLQVALGVDYVWTTPEARRSLGWDHAADLALSARAAAPIAHRKSDGAAVLFVTASARWTPDEQHARPVYTIGIRPVLFGAR